MSDLCDFVPDDPSCQTEPVIDDGHDGDHMRDGDDKMDGDWDESEREMRGKVAQIDFLVVALVNLANGYFT